MWERLAPHLRPGDPGDLSQGGLQLAGTRRAQQRAQRPSRSRQGAGGSASCARQQVGGGGGRCGRSRPAASRWPLMAELSSWSTGLTTSSLTSDSSSWACLEAETPPGSLGASRPPSLSLLSCGTFQPDGHGSRVP